MDLFQLDGEDNSSSDVSFRFNTSMRSQGDSFQAEGLNVTQPEMMDDFDDEYVEEEEIFSLDVEDNDTQNTVPSISQEQQQLNALLSGDWHRSESPEQHLMVQFSNWLVSFKGPGRASDPLTLLEKCGREFPAWLAQELMVLEERDRRLHGDSAEKRSLTQQISLLSGESDTWQLLNAVMGPLFRQQHAGAQAAVSVADAVTPYQRFVAQVEGGDPVLTKQYRVIQWLERVARRRLPRTGGMHNQLYREHSVNSHEPVMDPDATEGVSPLDLDFEKRLVKRIWALVRCGLVEQAITECQRCQHFWRAGTLRSWQKFHDQNLVDPKAEPGTEGNSSPDAWLEACRAIARDTSRSIHERALYGLFCGDSDAVLTVCESFEDVLWAYYKEMFFHTSQGHDGPHTEAQIFQIVSDDPAMLGKGKQFFPLVQQKIIARDLVGLARFLSLQMERAECPSLIRRFSCTLLLIMHRLDDSEIIAQSASRGVHTLVEHVSSFDAPVVVALHCRQLQESEAVEVYGRYLAQSMDDQSNQEQIDMMRTLQGEPGVALAHKRLKRKRLRYLNVAKIAGLPELRLALSVMNKLPEDTSEAVLLDILQSLSKNEKLLLNVVHMSNKIARRYALMKREAALLKLIEGMPTRLALLCRDVCERFGGNADVGETEKLESSFCFEYLYWMSLADTWRHCANWRSVFFGEKPKGEKPAPLGDLTSLGPSKAAALKIRHENATELWETELREWTRECEFLAEPARKSLLAFIHFENSPLFDGIEFGAVGLGQPLFAEDAETIRKSELKTIKQMYVPEAFTLLHLILHSHGRDREAMQLADLVASEKNGIYKLFCHDGSLEAFLQLIKQSGIANLAAGKDALGY